MRPPLLPARFQSAATLIKSRLNSDDAKLAILNFAMCRHHPDKIDRMPWHRYVGMKTSGHHDRITITHNADELGLVRIRVNELHAKRGRRHVIINIKLFEHRGVLVRRPTSPMSRL